MGLFSKPDVQKMEAEGDVEGLVKALGNEKDAILHLTARMALEGMGAQSVDALIQALKDKNEFLRWQAALALSNLGDDRAVEPIIEALGDKAEIVRRTAAAALGKMGDQRAVKPLQKLLAGEKPSGKYDVYYETAKSLETLGHKPN